MKELRGILFLLIIGTTLTQAQDWAPFKVGTQYYYGQYTSDGMLVDRFDVNSPALSEQLLYFHPVPCDDWAPFLHDEQFDLYRLHLGTEKPVLYILSGDIGHFTYLNSDRTALETFQFNHASKPGDQWSTNGVEMQCVYEDVWNFLGVTDSVRVFRCLSPPYDTLEFVLSRSYGMIKFPPLRNFERLSGVDFHPHFELIGLHDTTSAIGYQQPGFFDYFALRPGDVLLWQHIVQSYFPLMFRDTLYFLDTITQVDITSTSVTYEIRRGTYLPGGVFVENATHYAEYFIPPAGFILEGVPNWLSIDNIEELLPFQDQSRILHPLHLHISHADTVTIAHVGPALFYQDACDVQMVYDYGVDFYYSTGIGLVAMHDNFGHGYILDDLIGSIIDGVPDGVIEIPSLTQHHGETDVTLYPNPTSGLLYIEIPDLSIASYRIYNIHGRVVMQDAFRGSLDMHALDPGVYLAQFQTFETGRVMTAKIVKR